MMGAFISIFNAVGSISNLGLGLYFYVTGEYARAACHWVATLTFLVLQSRGRS